MIWDKIHSMAEFTNEYVRHLHISMVAFDVCIFRHEIYIALSQAANHVSSGEGFRVSK